MSRFIVVIHGWHVSSNGFSVHEIEASDTDHADIIAASMCMKKQSTFNTCAYKVIEIGSHETITKRKLTLSERITGNLNFE